MARIDSDAHFNRSGHASCVTGHWGGGVFNGQTLLFVDVSLTSVISEATVNINRNSSFADLAPSPHRRHYKR